MSTTPRTRNAALVLAGLALVGCGPAVLAHPTAPRQTAPSLVLQQRATLAAALSFTGTYSSARATFRVYVKPTAYRVDVIEAGATSALYGGTTRPAVACSGTTVCYAVAAAGQPVPTAFDAGIQRIFSRDLPTLAATAGGFEVTESMPPAAVLVAAPTARCFAVTRAGLAQPALQPLVAQTDVGTYCLDATGLPVALTFPTGTLTLTADGGAPTVAELTPPAVARALPPGVLPTAGPSGPAPVILPTSNPTGALTAISPVR